MGPLPNPCPLTLPLVQNNRASMIDVKKLNENLACDIKGRVKISDRVGESSEREGRKLTKSQRTWRVDYAVPRPTVDLQGSPAGSTEKPEFLPLRHPVEIEISHPQTQARQKKRGIEDLP